MSTKKTVQYVPAETRNFEGEVVASQVTAWKGEYGDRIYQLIRGTHCAYLRKPDRVIMAFLTTVPKDQFSQTLIDNCWLAGSEFLKTDEDAYLWLCGELVTLLDWGTGELKKI